jgi:hypothetical protein
MTNSRLGWIEEYDRLLRDARGEIMDARPFNLPRRLWVDDPVVQLDRALAKIVQARTLFLKSG